MDHVSRVGLFLKVVETGSFSAAARQLGQTGPAVSKQVAVLEDQLGVRLLTRTTRKLTLTEEGTIYADRARNALDDLQEAERAIQDLQSSPVGNLRVSAPLGFGSRFLTEPLATFAEHYPDVRMEIDLDDRHVDIIGERYDAVVRIGSLEDSSLMARKIADCPIFPVASRALVDRLGLPETPDDLARFPVVTFTLHGHYTDWRYRGPDDARGAVTLNSVAASNSGEMMEGLVEHGVAVGLLPIFHSYEGLKSGRLVRLLPEWDSDPERGIYVMYPRSRLMSVRVRLLVDWLSQCGQDFPWQANPLGEANPPG